MISVRFKFLFALVFVCLLISNPAARALSWFPYGPDGGDARAFAFDPRDHNHIYLGTAVGWVYETKDGGGTWKRLAQVGKRDDLVLDNIVIDPADSKHILIGAWVLGSSDGGLFTSSDAGVTWTSNAGLKGQSVLALSVAPSDSKTLVAGTLKGVFRSTDSGATWAPISPAGSQEIHEVESIAIDPAQPKTIYAGTWHLPWKTTDGGGHWHTIKQGIIEDSDVFSIIVDPKQPSTIYASACSGIYKSDNGGEKFAKIQGIPTTARRTRVLMQDPGRLQTVFAGTTEGLFRTDDAGTHWNRMTTDDVIINDVYVDPTNSSRVLLATDRGGVVASDDGGVSFHASNAGFSARQVTSITGDPHTPANLYIGIVNDKRWGGVFASKDGGLTWAQRADGLSGRDVFSMAESSDGTVIAGTEHGVYLYDSSRELWTQSGIFAPPPEVKRLPRVAASKRKAAAPSAAPKASPAEVKKVSDKPAPGKRIDSGVSSLALAGDSVYAVTTQGVFSATDPAKYWQPVAGLTNEPWHYIAAAQSTILLASLKSLTLSSNSGETWHMVPTPSALTLIGAVCVDDFGALWVGGREGIFVSTTDGATWESLNNLFIPDVNNILYDRQGHRLLITTNGSSTLVYSFHLPDRSIKAWDAGWNMRFVRPVGDYLLGATLFDGVVIQPRMVESKAVAMQ